MICQNCNKEIDDNAVYCRFCGEIIDNEKGREIKLQKMYKEERRQKLKKGVIISFVCFGLSLYLYLLFNLENLFRDDTSYYTEELDDEDIYDEDDSEDSYEGDVDDYDSNDSYEDNVDNYDSDDSYEDDVDDYDSDASYEDDYGDSYDEDYNTQTYEEYYGSTEDEETTNGEGQYRTGNNGDVYEDSYTTTFNSVWDYLHRNQ